MVRICLLSISIIWEDKKTAYWWDYFAIFVPGDVIQMCQDHIETAFSLWGDLFPVSTVKLQYYLKSCFM